MRNRYVFIADILILGLAVWVAHAVRFGWLFLQFRPEFWAFLIAAVFVKLPTFYLFGLYRRYWRYAGYWDLVAIVLANSAASAILMVVLNAMRPLGLIPAVSRSVLALDLLLAVAMTVGCRASVRAVAETMTMRPRPRSAVDRHVLIVGAGDAGAMVAREMQKNPQLGLRPIGFLDDARDKAHQQIYGLPVMGNIASMPAVAESRRVDEVVIAIPTAGGRTVRSVAERCLALGIPSRVMPGFYELLDGQVNVSRLRSLEITDLLRRSQVMSQSNPPGYLEGASVLVTGAGGSIGSELCRQVAHAKPGRLLLLGHGENSLFDIAGELRARFPSLSVDVALADVRDRDRLMRIFRQSEPSVVFHAAAHKHVPLMEENAAEAVTNNIVGTRNVTEAAVAVGVQRLVMVSTDKAVAPSNIMGASKRVAELVVQRLARQHGGAFVVVRFGNVLGSRGSVVPIFKAQIERGGPVTVTHPEVRRYFMTIPESVHLTLAAGGIGEGGELFVLDMGEPVLLRDMAADMIRLSGYEDTEVPIVYTGLRPGEKLNELLWEAGAVIEPTARVDVRRVLEPMVVPDDVLDAIVDRLAAAAAADDHHKIVRLFHECLPSAALTAKPRPSASRSSGVVVQLPRA
ncbi:MAG TPA: nucleoside-diphosphate sugar epimerase/dehydratase [Vicinamibacterales bacterium]|nr:nucleoside-diphosphate sugar epimerase/dehydratase [Vicinamibacterales bacterium]